MSTVARPTTTIVIRLSEDLANRVRELSKITNQSISMVCRLLIRKGLIAAYHDPDIMGEPLQVPQELAISPTVRKG